jgi:hypothetical protein
MEVRFMEVVFDVAGDGNLQRKERLGVVFVMKPEKQII